MSTLRFLIYIIFIAISLVKINNVKKDCIFYDTLCNISDGPLLLKMRTCKESLLLLNKIEFYIFAVYVLVNFLPLSTNIKVISIGIFIIFLVIVESLSYRQNSRADIYFNEQLWREVDNALSKLPKDDLPDDKKNPNQ